MGGQKWLQYEVHTFLWCGTGFWFGVWHKHLSGKLGDLEAPRSSLAVLIIPQVDQIMCFSAQSNVSGYSFQLCLLVPPFFVA